MLPSCSAAIGICNASVVYTYVLIVILFDVVAILV